MGSKNFLWNLKKSLFSFLYFHLFSSFRGLNRYLGPIFINVFLTLNFASWLRPKIRPNKQKWDKNFRAVVSISIFGMLINRFVVSCVLDIKILERDCASLWG